VTKLFQIDFIWENTEYRTELLKSVKI